MTTQKVVIEFTFPEAWDDEDFVAELVGCYYDSVGYDEDGETHKAELVEYRVTSTTKGNKQ